MTVLELLKTNSTLVHLNISNQGCGDTAFSQLCRALYQNTKLQSLKFPGNNLSYNGFLAFEQSLLNNTTLKWIEFFDEKELPYEKVLPNPLPPEQIFCPTAFYGFHQY